MTHDSGAADMQYLLLPNGIHQFTFYRASKEGIDEFFHILEAIFSSTSHEETARYILDITGSEGTNVSLVSGTQRFRMLETRYAHRARGRTAVLHQPGITYTLLDSFIRALAPRRDVTRFFPVDRREEAVGWLLQEA